MALHSLIVSSGSVPGPGEEEVEESESYRTGSLPKDPSLDPTGSAGPHEFRKHESRCQKQWCGLGERAVVWAGGRGH